MRNTIRRLGFDIVKYPPILLRATQKNLELEQLKNLELKQLNELLKSENEQLQSQNLGLANELAISENGKDRVSYDYDEDCLKVTAKSMNFLESTRFIESYSIGMQSGHHIGRPKESTDDIGIRWRIHTCCWAATHAAKLSGDFVECGVNTGIMSLAVCNYIDFNSLKKDFYLFDTFCGVPGDQASAQELINIEQYEKNYYSECFELAKQNFASYPNARLIQGKVPDTLSKVDIKEVCYLHIDMNIVYPEMAAIKHFWPLLTPSAIVILDDYGWKLHNAQRIAMDQFASEQGVEIYTAPTGQGILIKP